MSNAAKKQDIPEEIANLSNGVDLNDQLSQYETGTRKLILKTQLYFWSLIKKLEAENKELKQRVDALEGNK